ncbi:MAG: protein kinase domain-containing protein [Anaerolineae bacterium]
MLEQLVGQSLDRYQIVSLLGEGGMGAVFKAQDITLQRDVAIKVMQPQAARLPNFQERFLQEARTAARLDHPGIVKVYDFGQARGLLYIVMAYIAGQDLRRMLDDLQATGRWIALPEALALMRELCLSVDYAHRHGILHRDLKPSNVMLAPEPMDDLPYRPILTDLGLAKLVEGDQLTQDGTSMGTPSYMSPEQAMGEDTDARSDVYSLGVLCFELATGQLPFPIKTLTQAIRYHTKEAPPAPRTLKPDLPANVEAIILRAMQKDPAERYPDAGAMAKALQEAAGGAGRSDLDALTMASAAGQVTQFQDIASQGQATLDQFAPTPEDLGHDRIVLLAPSGATRTFPLQGTEVVIGRAADADLVIDDRRASRHHVQVRFDDAEYRVLDLNSSNGTFMGSTKLLPGVPEIWTPDKILRVGDHLMKLERARAGAPSLAMPRAASAGTYIGRAEESKRVSAFADVAELVVDPGDSVVVPLTLLNQGPVVDHFQITVLGLPAGWLPAPPPLIRLLPGRQEQASVVIQPPRMPASRAGAYPLILRVASQDRPDQVVEVPLRLVVNPYAQYQSELRPQVVQAGKPGQVRLTNQGNAPQQFTFTLHDRAEELAFSPASGQISVAEGQSAALDYTAAPRQRRWIGARKVHPFTIELVPQAGPKQALNGEVQSKALIPAWVPPLVVIPLIALCALLFVMLRKPPVIASVIVDPASPSVGQAVTVRWVVENAQRIELRPLVSDLDAGLGEYTFQDGLPASTTFTLVAHGRFGEAEQPVTIGVIAPTPTPTAEPSAPIIEEWSLSAKTITKGQTVTLRWRVSNAESVSIQPLGNVENDGELQDAPQQTIRYTLVAINQGKSVTRSEEVVVELPLPGAPVVAAFSAEPGLVVRGETSTVRLIWDTQGADSVAIEPGLGPVGSVGNRDVPAPAGDTTYILVAKNAGGETRAEALVQVVDPTPTATATATEEPLPTDTLAPAPVVPTDTPVPAGPTWKHPVTLLDRRAIYNLRLVQAGQIRVRATWTGSQSGLALIINGPGQTGAYARKDGSSPLEVVYDVSDANLAAGEHWWVSVASFGTGEASGTVEITYPGGSSVSPFSDSFTVKQGYATSISVVVIRRLLVNGGGTLEARATWTGSPADLALILNGPGQVGYYARQDGASPLVVTYSAADADLDKGDTWRFSLVSFSAANAQGEVELNYPYMVLRLAPLRKIAP